MNLVDMRVCQPIIDVFFITGYKYVDSSKLSKLSPWETQKLSKPEAEVSHSHSASAALPSIEESLYQTPTEDKQPMQCPDSNGDQTDSSVRAYVVALHCMLCT